MTTCESPATTPTATAAKIAKKVDAEVMEPSWHFESISVSPRTLQTLLEESTSGSQFTPQFIQKLNLYLKPLLSLLMSEIQIASPAHAAPGIVTPSSATTSTTKKLKSDKEQQAATPSIPPLILILDQHLAKLPVESAFVTFASSIARDVGLDFLVRRLQPESLPKVEFSGTWLDECCLEVHEKEFEKFDRSVGREVVGPVLLHSTSSSNAATTFPPKTIGDSLNAQLSILLNVDAGHVVDPSASVGFCSIFGQSCCSVMTNATDMTRTDAASLMNTIAGFLKFMSTNLSCRSRQLHSHVR